MPIQNTGRTRLTNTSLVAAGIFIAFGTGSHVQAQDSARTPILQTNEAISIDANANENEAWLINPFRKGEDDMGRCYGAQGRDWRNPENESIDQLVNIINDLKQGIDNRSEIMTFMK